MSSLYTYNHQLDYDEAVRRLQYWADNLDKPYAQSALRTLATILERDRDRLYFEPKTEHYYTAQARRVAEQYNRLAEAERRPDLEETE